jgi:hypothetical protein
MEEDTLDAIEAPLRRLFASEGEDDDSSDDLLPPAPPLLHQIVQIQFVAPHKSEELETSYRTITISLSVDPRPGCGGIAWPAGKVGQ